MHELKKFANEIEHRLQEAENRRRREGGKLADTMRPRDETRLAFERVAEVVHSAIVRPRCEELARRFAEVTVEHLATPGGMYTLCVFHPTDRFPATAVLCVGIALDEDRAKSVLSCSVEFTPALVEYEPADTIAVPLEATPWDDLATWLEAKLLRFVESYLLVERHPAYQQDNVHIDPVCGMTVPASVAIETVVYNERTFYFCASSCRERFMGSPELFLKGAVPLSHVGAPRRDVTTAPQWTTAEDDAP